MTTRSDESKNDAQLVSDILVSNQKEVRESCYRVLLERHWTVVVVLVQSRLPSYRDAEEVAQEAFIRAWKSLAQLDQPQRFLGWLLRIAQNQTTDWLRKRRPSASLNTIDVSESRRLPKSAEDASEKIVRDEEWNLTRVALRELPEPYQTVIVLRYLEGWTNQEMAQALDEPEGTIRNRLFRALGKLRAALKKQGALKEEGASS